MESTRHGHRINGRGVIRLHIKGKTEDYVEEPSPKDSWEGKARGALKNLKHLAPGLYLDTGEKEGRGENMELGKRDRFKANRL